MDPSQPDLRPAPLATTGMTTPFLDSLHAHGRLRVWSIVITIFGDMVQPRSHSNQPARLALSDLAQLVGGLGITAGALRTAVSRLTKEGWLARHKEGRSTWYQLSASGARHAKSASERIYAPAIRPAAQAWRLELSKPAQDIREALPQNQRRFALSDSVSLTPLDVDDLAQGSEAARAAHDTLVVEGKVTNFPAWMFETLIPANLTRDYAELEFLLATLAEQAAELPGLPPSEAIVLRCLLVHFWRRLVLKHRPIPLNLMPSDWPGLACSRLLPPLYAALWTASEAWLDAAGLPSRHLEAPNWALSV